MNRSSITYEVDTVISSSPSLVKINLISKELQLAPSYWHGCQYPATWM